MGLHSLISHKLSYYFFGGNIADCICSNRKTEKYVNEYVKKVVDKFSGLLNSECYERLDGKNSCCDIVGVGVECHVLYPRQFIEDYDDPRYAMMDCLFITYGTAYLLFDYNYASVDKNVQIPDRDTLMKYAVAVYRKFGELYNINSIEISAYYPDRASTLYPIEPEVERLTYDDLNYFTISNYRFSLRKRHIS